jgi:hypothetical protein
MKAAALSVAALLLATVPSNAITVEFLQASIRPGDSSFLSGLACRNIDHIVHLDISVDWQQDKTSVEQGSLVFWAGEDEFDFPQGSYFFLHGSYIIKGYFIVRSGGTHQGVTASSFERVNDAQVMLSPGLTENKMTSGRCP